MVLKKALAVLLVSVISLTALFSCKKNKPIEGSEVGNLCPTYNLEKLGGGTDNVKNYRGKTVIIHFWGVWASELSAIDSIATDYKDSVKVLAIHTDHERAKAPDYIEKHHKNSEIIFLYDERDGNREDKYYTMLGGTDAYPRTVILNSDGVITYVWDGALTYDELKAAIEDAKK